MKALLGCLMCLVLPMSQAFAISGGPFSGGGHPAVTGIYSGVMNPQFHVCIDDTGKSVPCPGQSGGINSLGIFTLTLPKSGAGTGTVVIFDEGQVYNGTIKGSGDPQTGKISGQIEAHFTFQESVLASTEVTTDSSGKTTTKYTYAEQSFSATAAGGLIAKAKAAKSGTFSSSGVRLGGTADMQFSLAVNSPFDEISYRVVGFKQAEAGSSSITGQ